MQKYDGQLFRKFQDVTDGIAAVGVSVTVRNLDDNNISAIYSDAAGLTSKSNPTATDGNGYYFFYADGGDYKISFSNGFPDIEVSLGSIGKSIISEPSGITLNVPSTKFPKIKDAMLYLATKRILGDTSVLIKLADGIHYLSESVILNHLDGAKISIKGNTSNRANCKIKIENEAANGGPTFDAFIVSSGYKFGTLDGFEIILDSKAGPTRNFTAVLAVDGANIARVGPAVYVNNWYYGVAARINSEIVCDYVEVNNSGDVGIWAYVGSTIKCNNAISNNASDVTNNLGFGIQAEFGSTIECTAASASGCRIAGIASLSNGVTRAHNAIASNNVGSGFYASADGHIEHHGATANNNTRFGEERVLGGTIIGGSVTLSDNTLGSANGYAYFDNSGPTGARIASNGNLRIDVNGANEVYFNSSGGVQAQVTHTAASNSWMMMRASAGGQPGIEATGTPELVDANVRGKGNGRVFLASQRGNFLAVSGSNSGSGLVILEPEGVDANADVMARGRGTGKFRWGVHSAGSITPNGYVEWKLEDGATVRVAAQRL